ncbi:transposase [Vibrio parahaemolyticus]|uniref:transposase n=1 Tax=Vibrio parahaemolyticus TaxID=670 RepID=UPI0035313BF3
MNHLTTDYVLVLKGNQPRKAGGTNHCKQLVTAQQALNAIRSHWQIESMHWMLDVTFREDESRIRRGTGALAFNALRKITLSLFKQDTSKNISMVREKIAAIDDEYHSALLKTGIKML